MEPADATGIKAKIAIVIQVRAGNPADDADDGKVVTDDDDVIVCGMTLGDLIQPHPGALGDVDQPLASGNLELGRFGAPAAQEFAEVCPDLAECQSFEPAVIELTKAFFDSYG